MISQLFHTVIYDPLYNGLVFFVGIVPGHDVGLAVIALTVITRVLIYPLSKRAIETQMAMKKIAPDVEIVKEKYKNDRQEQGKAIFALYKERGVHPFAGIGLMIIQLPVLIGLYWVFYGGGFPDVNLALLYSFVHAPESVNMDFLGILGMDKRSIVLAVLAGVTQLAYSRLSMGPRGTQTAAEATFSNEMAKSLDLQARYVLPVIMGVVGYTTIAAVPLYLTTSNLFMIGQEFIAGRRWNGESQKA